MTEVLHTPVVWGEKYGVQVLDPDGWREDGKSFHEPITYEEWKRRLWISTVYAPPGAWEALP